MVKYMSSQFSIQVSPAHTLPVSKTPTEPKAVKAPDASSDDNAQSDALHLSESPVVHKDSNIAQNQDLLDAVKRIQQEIQHSRREIRFEVNEETGISVVSVLDHDTKKVIRQFPPDEILALAERVSEMEASGGKLFSGVV